MTGYYSKQKILVNSRSTKEPEKVINSIERIHEYFNRFPEVGILWDQTLERYPYLIGVLGPWVYSNTDPNADTIPLADPASTQEEENTIQQVRYIHAVGAWKNITKANKPFSITVRTEEIPYAFLYTTSNLYILSYQRPDKYTIDFLDAFSSSRGVDDALRRKWLLL